MNALTRAASTILLVSAAALAQGPPQPPPPPNQSGPQPREFRRGPDGPPNGQRWWSHPDTMRDLNVTPDQRKKLDDTFQQHRLRMVDLSAALQKDEMILEPLISADSPDEPKVLAQIDKVAQDRAEIEKADARFFMAIRRILSPDQWQRQQSRRLQGQRPEPAGPRPPQPGPRRG